MKAHGRIFTLIVLMTAAVTMPANSQTGRWRKFQGRPLIKFDWGCASPSAYPAAKLKRVVKTSMARRDFSGFGTWGDRAFAFDLNNDRRLEYFVPLDCGGTGNCYWGIFALNPTRELGLIGGEYIYVHRLKGRWPDLVTYGHLSAMEGSLHTYRFSGKRYASVGSSYPINHTEFALDIQGGMGHKMPAFLEKAKLGCESLGS